MRKAALHFREFIPCAKRLCLLILLMFVGIQAFAQKITTDVQHKSVRAILAEIEKVSPYKFFYREDMPGLNSVTSLQIQDASIDDALTALFKGANITFTKEANNVVVLTDSTSQRTSERVLRGNVKNDAGNAVSGAVVMLSNGKGTVTSGTGNFEINPEDSKSFTVSYLGYESKEVNIGAATYYNVTLSEGKTLLDEVVVVGYGTQKRKDITTAVSVVSTKDIAERPIVSAAQAIEGKAAGVQVIQPSGAPGSGLSIRVRGSTSVQASNDPLYVVDGIPMDDISNLAPSDIESLQILKDASSAAIYGARAANGVVLISTKKGEANQGKVRFSAYSGFSWLGNTLSVLNTEDYKALLKEISVNIPNVPTVPDDEHRYTDWQKDFFKTGVEQNYQVSFQNGTDKLQYYLSGGYTDQSGIAPKSGYSRYNLRANIDSDQTKWLKLTFSAAYTHSITQAISQNVTSMRGGSILALVNTPPFMQKWDPDNPGQYDEFAYGTRSPNPFAAIASDGKDYNDRFITAFGAGVKLLKGLNYKLNLSMDLSNYRGDSYTDPLSTSDSRAVKGNVWEGYSRNADYLMENILTYDKTFCSHNISLLAGSTIERATSSWLNMSGFDLMDVYPNIRGIAAANQVTRDPGAGSGAWDLASFIGRINYNYMSKYLLTANIRADGSSKFAPGKQWGYFPSVSAGWRISSEKFMESAKNVVTDLKIRVGWGMTGNQGGIGNYDYLAQYNAVRQQPVLPTDTDPIGVPYPGWAISPGSAANPDLTWEKTTQMNIGLDAALFNSRLNLTLDLYDKRTTDLLLTIPLPATVNIPWGITRNDGEMHNKGLEVLINSVNIDKKLRWTTDFNISFNRNEIVKLGLNKIYYFARVYNRENVVTVREGIPLGSFFGYVADGVDPETGDMIFKDVNKNGIFDPGDRTIIGNPNPKFYYGMTNNLFFKGFNLSLFLQGTYGNDIYNATKTDMEDMSTFRNQSTTVLRRWKRPGQITDIPRAGNDDNNVGSSRYVEDGSYLRLKAVTLSYDFQPSLLKKIGISKIQPYVTGQNLFTLTKYSGYDPEVNNTTYGSNVVQGVDYGTYPQSRVVIFGLNVEF